MDASAQVAASAPPSSGDATSASAGTRVPARTLLGAIEEAVDRVAAFHGRLVDLQVSGDELPVEPGAVQPILRAMAHALDNAVRHGLEPPEERGDKPLVGELELSLEEDETWWRVTLTDDGVGLDGEAVVARAVERGVVAPARAERLAPHERIAIALLEGVGLGPTGHGGLSHLRRAVDAAGAHLEVRTTRGEGTMLRVHVPRRAARLGSPRLEPVLASVLLELCGLEAPDAGDDAEEALLDPALWASAEQVVSPRAALEPTGGGASPAS